jgi:hypothetical protein
MRKTIQSFSFAAITLQTETRSRRLLQARTSALVRLYTERKSNP